MDSGEFWKREHEKLDWKTPLKSLDLSQKEVENNRASQVVLVVKNLPANQCRNLIRDSAVIPGSGRSPGGGHVNPFQCSCLEKPMDKSQTELTLVDLSQQGCKESDTIEANQHREKGRKIVIWSTVQEIQETLAHYLLLSTFQQNSGDIAVCVCVCLCVCEYGREQRLW